MNLRLTLMLMSLPPLIGSLLMLGFTSEWALAVEASNTLGTTTTEQATCDEPRDRGLESSILPHHNQAIMVASNGPLPSEPPIFDFSEAESDAATVLFGCDCSACIKALRQLQNPSLLNGGSGHCWTSMQRRVSPQTLQSVLEDLRQRQTEQPR